MTLWPHEQRYSPVSWPLFEPWVPLQRGDHLARKRRRFWGLLSCSLPDPVALQVFLSGCSYPVNTVKGGMPVPQIILKTDLQVKSLLNMELWRPPGNSRFLLHPFVGKAISPSLPPCTDFCLSLRVAFAHVFIFECHNGKLKTPLGILTKWMIPTHYLYFRIRNPASWFRKFLDFSLDTLQCLISVTQYLCRREGLLCALRVMLVAVRFQLHTFVCSLSTSLICRTQNSPKHGCWQRAWG